MPCRMRPLVLAACVMLPGLAAAQSAPSLLDAYGRTVALLHFMSTYVSASLLACAEKNVLTEAQAEGRYRAYRERNAALLERADVWKQQAEARMRSQGQEHAGRERLEQAGMSATAAALARVRQEIEKVSDVRALCSGKFEGIEAGRYDLSGNAEFVGLLKTDP